VEGQENDLEDADQARGLENQVVELLSQMRCDKVIEVGRYIRELERVLAWVEEELLIAYSSSQPLSHEQVDAIRSDLRRKIDATNQQAIQVGDAETGV
jgi:hypothetical protein